MKAKHVLYDGKCGLCNKEIAYYRSIDADDKFKWVDITIEKNLARYPSINLREALLSLHVVEGEQIKSGVDAFIAIWSELGNFKILAFFINYLQNIASKIYLIAKYLISKFLLLLT